MHWIRRIGWSALIVFLGVALPSLVSAQTFINWEEYLHDPAHSSFNNQATAITPANATALVPAWTWRAGSNLLASPTVYNGLIYIGAKSGVFYALDEATGAVVWQRFLGQTPKLTCQGGPFGLVATATVAVDPSTQVPTVYAYSPDGNLYALNAGDGTIVWSSNVFTPSSTVNDYFAWSSPAVINGMVYVGISSLCANPPVRGGVKAFQQATGAPIATYFSVPEGVVGASVWSSVAVSPSGNVLVTTGEGPTEPGDAVSVVRLDGQTLAKLDIWTVPESEQIPDSDFGGSPTIFQANLGGTVTPMVGACNKNGVYYALRLDSLAAGPVWTFQAGNPEDAGTGQCIAAAIWDGSRLFVASNGTTIGDVPFGGSIRELDPATGAVIWNTGLPDAVYGSPTENGAGVIALATYDESPGQTAAYLIDASNGSILKTISTSNVSTFAQPVFADEFVFVATIGGRLTPYKIGP